MTFYIYIAILSCILLHVPIINYYSNFLAYMQVIDPNSPMYVSVKVTGHWSISSMIS